jgi:CheY-like chemotaxis protein
VSCPLTDVGLPGELNGRQLADEARRRRPGLKVLFATGYARNAIVHHGRLDPGVELISKPFTYAALAAKIRQVLESGAEPKA